MAPGTLRAFTYAGLILSLSPPPRSAQGGAYGAPQGSTSHPAPPPRPLLAPPTRAAQLYAERTFWQTDVEVDHSLTRGPRYDISYEHAAVVRPLVDSARVQLCKWLREAHNGTHASSRFSPCEEARATKRSPAVPRVRRLATRPHGSSANSSGGSSRGRRRRRVLRKGAVRPGGAAAERPQSRSSTTTTTTGGPGSTEAAGAASENEARRMRHARLLEAVQEWNDQKKSED
jgi:hypothetical protein